VDDDLIVAEVEALQTLAGQRRRNGSLKEWLCLEELSARGLCTANSPRRITPKGLAVLQSRTNTVVLRPQRYLDGSFPNP
jgi:hypothetical protein